LRSTVGSKQGKLPFLHKALSSLHGLQDWSFESLFDRTIDRSCPVAESSEVLVSLPQNAIYAIKPEPWLVDGNTAKYDVKASMWDGCFLVGILISSSSK
jgi:hypothetical protein